MHMLLSMFNDATSNVIAECIAQWTSPFHDIWHTGVGHQSATGKDEKSTSPLYSQQSRHAHRFVVAICSPTPCKGDHESMVTMTKAMNGPQDIGF